MKAPKRKEGKKTHPWRMNNPLSPKTEPSKVLPNYNYRVLPR